jgi:hypothetical protein
LNYLAHSKGDACDVETFAEYEDVAKKILERQPTRAVVIFVDMKDVEKAANKVCLRCSYTHIC